MRRRELIALLAGAAVSWPLLARAQIAGKPAVIGWLSGGSQAGSWGFVEAFLKGMRESEYVEGRDFRMVYRWADGYVDRLPGLAAELVALKPDLILAPASGPAVAAKKATSTIPIVTPALADAVHLGLVASEARPGGNVTGITPYVAGLPAKQMELAREIVPGARTIGVLNDVKDAKAPPQWEELQAAGRALGVSLTNAPLLSPDDIAGAFAAFAAQRPDVIIVLQTSMLVSERRKIAELAASARLPALYEYREHIVDGGLISYGVDLRDCFRRSAAYVNKILHGTPPGDLPIEFPTRLELVVNLKAAKALGLEVPPTLLTRADEVIE